MIGIVLGHGDRAPSDENEAMTDTAISHTVAIRRAMAYVNAPAAKVAADRERPQCHFLPPARWMNDPNGTIFHNGWYHIFYQLNPFGDTWGFMHWGHARSLDLVHWEHLPIALAPDVEHGEEHCFSGCIGLDHDGQPRLLYTSIGFSGTRPALQCMATSTDPDLKTWQRNLTQAIPGTMSDDARDPFIFTWQGRTFVILGDQQRVPLYEAIDGDLNRLVERAPLFVADAGQIPFCECPNFLPVGPDRWLLLLSPYRPVEWYLGTFDGERFVIERHGRLDERDSFYATNTLTDDTGRTVVLGWIRGFPGGRDWNGCLALSRLIELDERAGIRQQFHPSIAALRQGQAQSWQGTVVDKQVVAVGLTSAVEVQLSVSGSMVLRVCGINVVWDGRYLTVGDTVLDLDLAQLDLHLVVDRTVIEVFADGGRRVITRIVAVPNRDELVVVTASKAVIQSTIYHLSATIPPR